MQAAVLLDELTASPDRHLARRVFGSDRSGPALAAIRKDETLRDSPGVAVTAGVVKGNREAILAKGFDGCLSKPIDAKMLHKTITKVLHG